MKAESSSTKIKYITFKQLMGEVREDLRQYDENNMIEDARLLKHVVRCSEFLGERLHQSKQCKITVVNYSAPMPEDLWKIENMYGISETTNDLSYFKGIFGGGMIFNTDKDESLSAIPSFQDRIQYLGILPEADCCQPMHVSAYDSQYFERVEGKQIFPLVLTNHVSDKCTIYSPCTSWTNGYEVDLQEDMFKFSFKSGEIFLSYLGQLINNEGDLLIPDDEMILPFYEWTLKKIILEDLFMNSEADVINKYNLAKLNLVESKIQAMNHINSFKAGQLDMLSKKRKMQFYNDWMKKFD